MVDKTFPFLKSTLEEVSKQHPTPFYIYDENAIRQQARSLNQAFSWNNGFKEYFAVKAAPNPFILKILKQDGLGLDCSSLSELNLAEKAGLMGEEIMFSSNDTPIDEFIKAASIGAIINFDDINHISFLDKYIPLPNIICLRFNPGHLKTGNLIIGHPVESKFGLTQEQLFDGYRLLRDKGVKRFGLHTMVASNELDLDYFIETADMLFQLVIDISKKLGIRFEFVNLGGGIGIPYEPDQQHVDLQSLSDGIKLSYQERIVANNLDPLKIFLECGRLITGPFGYLVTRVRHIKNSYKDFVGLDACMADLMRPGLYGAYHHISVPGKESWAPNKIYDVTGSLCENNDKFAINRHLPELAIGDLLVIHDTGAHGHAMGFNYNGKLRSAELLLRPTGKIILIRRAETMDDYFATIDFHALDNFL
ncbi:MAG: diaminopimelate decarboxylase [Chloroflexota bacterium]